MKRDSKLIGQKFGKLLVVERAHTIKKEIKTTPGKYAYRIYYKCTCDCGNECIVQSANLRNKSTQSCGCIRKDQTTTQFTNRLYNKKENSGFTSLIKSYERGSIKRGLEFSLTKKEFETLTKSNCFYCGVAPKTKVWSDLKQVNNTESSTYTYNGIDRVDNNKGYVFNNCVSCCKECNRAKYNMSYTDFMKWINKLVNYNTIT